MLDDQGLRKGPWTVHEDVRLIAYISLHGEGRWNLLAKSAGLRRNGKSCRLRWMNYLRPDLKRGNISLEEEQIIIDLQRRWGNRWSRIARHLPGRTDNEIKNYWRTRIRRKFLSMELQPSKDFSSGTDHNLRNPNEIVSTSDAVWCNEWSPNKQIQVFSSFVKENDSNNTISAMTNDSKSPQNSMITTATQMHSECDHILNCQWQNGGSHHSNSSDKHSAEKGLHNEHPMDNMFCENVWNASNSVENMWPWICPNLEMDFS